MEPRLSVVIPVGAGHVDIVQRAIQSVLAQTVPCAPIVVHDADKRGPGYVRNVGLSLVNTEFVTFLDADDWLVPTYAERMLYAFAGGAYVYSDWFEDGQLRVAPEQAWQLEGTWHIITTLLPTAWAREGGGFDESLPGGEDEDFYRRLFARAKCGRRWGEALVHYTGDGGRGKTFRFGPDYIPTKELIRARYIGKMACGCEKAPPNVPIGEHLDSDVLAMALWMGNREQLGLATGRRYRRMSYPRQTWVDPRDIEKTPHLWSIVPQDTKEAPVPANPNRRTALDVLANAFMDGVQPPAYSPPAPEPKREIRAVPPVVTRPDWTRIIAAGKR